MKWVGAAVRGAMEWLRDNAASGRPESSGRKPPLEEFVRAATVSPYEVLWVSASGAVSSQEFWSIDEATRCHDEHKEGSIASRVCRHGNEVARRVQGGAHWRPEWESGHAAGCRRVQDMFPPEQLRHLGQVAWFARVRFDAGMSHMHHGHAQRCPKTKVPMCVVNPSAQDHEYVVLHELFHHILDSVGCPALHVPILHRRGDGALFLGEERVPDSSCLQAVNVAVDASFTARIIQTVWELIQHSRFNPLIREVFKRGPEKSRDSELTSLLDGTSSFSYCSFGSDPQGLWMLAMQIHFCTALLEASPRVTRVFEAFLKDKGADGAMVEARGQAMAKGLQTSAAVSIVDLNEDECEALVCGMLMDLEVCLNALPLGLRARVGPLQTYEEEGAFGEHRAVSAISFLKQ